MKRTTGSVIFFMAVKILETCVFICQLYLLAFIHHLSHLDSQKFNLSVHLSRNGLGFQIRPLHSLLGMPWPKLITCTTPKPY